VTLTATADGRSPEVVRDQVLESLAQPGLDLDSARERFRTRCGRRRRARWIVSGVGVLLVVAVGLTTMLLSDGPEPDAVLADGDDVATTTLVTTTTTPDPVATEVAVAPVTVPTAIVPATTAPPSTEPPPPAAEESVAPTVPAPNRPMTATLAVSPPVVEAGAPVTAVVSWLDEDLAGGPPRHVVAWGDPLLSTPVDTGARTSCDAPGVAASGHDALRFRYSTPGTYEVRVVTETCGGVGSHSERVVTTGTVTVTAPRIADPSLPGQTVPGQTVVVFQPPTAGALWASLDRAIAEYLPEDEGTAAVALAAGDAVAVFTTSGPATVYVVPVGADGRIRLRWPEPTGCATTARSTFVDDSGAAIALPLTPGAC